MKIHSWWNATMINYCWCKQVQEGALLYTAVLYTSKYLPLVVQHCNIGWFIHCCFSVFYRSMCVLQVSCCLLSCQHRGQLLSRQKKELIWVVPRASQWSYLSTSSLPGIASTFFFFFFDPIYYLRRSILPPSRNSDPGSHSRLFYPPTHYGSCLAFLSREDFSSSLVDSRR